MYVLRQLKIINWQENIGITSHYTAFLDIRKRAFLVG